METIIFDFAIGIAIGAISELLFLRGFGRRTRLHKKVPGSHTRNRLRGVPRSIKPARVRRVAVASPRARFKVQLDTELNPVQSPVTYSEPPQFSCPTCGLMAPDKLMAEHLLGSPLHRKQAMAPVAPRTPPSTTSARKIAPLEEEDSRESMRNLLQMLVPPRAFGRRHGQRTANPLGQLVQTLD